MPVIIKLRHATEFFRVHMLQVQLQNVEISGYAKESIMNIVNSDINRLNKKWVFYSNEFPFDWEAVC